MSQRIRVPTRTAMEMVRHLARLSEMHGDSLTYVRTVLEIGLDLADARTRIAELERLSASQEEAHAARDRGVSL